jgi:hypothetical protein
MEDIFRQEFLSIAEHQCREDTILRNGKLSCADRVLLIVLERLYPDVRTRRVKVALWQLAKHAGVSPKSASRFFIAMHECGYMSYVVVRVIGLDVENVSSVRSECSVEELWPCDHPETLDTRDAPRRKEHRKKVKERLRCRFCGSENIGIVCLDCGKELV